MEFAITAPVTLTGADDSWQPSGSRSFLFGKPAGYLRARQGGRRIGATLRLALIAIFGAAGTLARYGLQGVVQVRTASTFPVGTLLVNLTGCFLLGLIGQFTLNRMVISPDWRVAIAVGFFGGYTTFSSFGWETAKMLEAGEWAWATAYVGASVVAGLLLSVAGIRLANRF
jgi:CrcB protein